MSTEPRSATSLPRSFYRRGAPDLARDLLNKVLVVGDRSGRIVEVEAYRGEQDPGSHAYRGRTERNATMFGPPGGLYVYFTYGMHWCANVVGGEEGEAQAVLLRALAPLTGIEAMRAARPAARRDLDLCRGPARLCQALGVDGSYDGIDLVSGEQGVVVVDDGVPPPPRPGRGPRIGLTNGADLALRWWVPGEPHVSGSRRANGGSAP